MNQLRKTFMLLVGAALFLGLTVTSVAASSNAGTAVSTDNPATAVSIDGARHTLAANSVQWFKFNYNATRNDDGSRNTVTVSIPNLTTPNIGFDVYTPDQIADWWELDPIGRGSPRGIVCGQIDANWSYTCQIYSLDWTGKFPTNGTFYVRVKNDNPFSVPVTLTEHE